MHNNFTFKETIFFFAFCMVLNLPNTFGNSATENCTDDEVIELQSDNSRHTVFLTSFEKKITLCNLKVGREYNIVLSSFEQAPECVFEISHSFEKRYTSYISDNNSLDFQAVADCMDFVIRNSNCITDTDYPVEISVGCKNCDSSVQNLMQMAGITTDPNYSPQQLIEDVFIGGGCFEISNVTPIGNTQGIGYFSDGGSSVSIDEGVILATGVIANAHGPNTVTNITTDFGDNSGDQDLNILSGGSVFDAVGIEFDFTPTVDMIEFNYVFASDEYCDYVNTQFNDVFGFFISGPGISGGYSLGGANIALVPGTGLDVSINNVNIQTNSAYYVDNVPIGQPQQGPFPCTQDLSQPGAAEDDCEYDGFTTVLTAQANVQVCETYHIRLVVGDVGDGIFDSAVFLQANSFSAGGEASMSFDIPGILTNGVAYEGCSGGYIIFERPDDSNLSEDLVVEFTIDPSSTATSGIDFSTLPSSITIPAGQTQFILPFDIFTDDLIEGIETLILNLANPCTCDEASIELLISDVDPLEVITPNLEFCNETTTQIPANVIGGVPNYTYLWDNGMTSPTITVDAPLGTSYYTVTVSDECGNTEESTATVIVAEQETATIEGFVEVCSANPTGTLTITFEGEGPWDLVIYLDGVPQPPIIGITENPYAYTVTEIGTYTIGSLYVGPCPGIGLGIGSVIEPLILLVTVPEDVSCFGMDDGSIDLVIAGTSPEYTYEWSNGTYDEDLANLGPGIYSVTVTDINGCTNETSEEIFAPDEILAEAVETQAVYCLDPNSGAADLTVSGGNPAYTFEWDNGSTEEDPTNLSAGLHTVTVTDVNGCTEETSVDISVESLPPDVEAEVSGILTCDSLEVTLDGSNSNGNDITFEWFNENDSLLSVDPQIDVNEIGAYTLVVTNSDNGCTADTIIVVQEDIQDPTAEAGDSNVLNCNVTEVTLDGSGSSIGDSITYSWQDDSNTEIGNEISIDVDIPGTYTLIVTNIDNGCTSLDEVIIDEDIESPTPVASVDSILTCLTIDATLDGSGSSGSGPLVFQWLDDSNTEIADTAVTIVSTPGVYTLIITNTENGCTDQTTLEVFQDIENPVAFIEEPEMLNCSIATIQLDGNSSSGSALSYQWLDSGSNEIGNDTIIEVDSPDTYTLIVTNTENGCTNENSVVVEQDIEDPQPVAEVDGILTCSNEQVLLDGSSSGGNGALEYEWLDPDNNSIGIDSIIEVDVPGIYTLFIVNIENGCTAEEVVEVEQDIVPPVADPGLSPTLDCAVTVVTLDGSNSSSNGGAIVYQWLDINQDPIGNNPTIDVDSASIYTLVVTAENGCTDFQDIEVFSDTELPNADPGEEGTLNCNISVITIGGPGSSTGNEISYQWFNSSNMLVGNNPTIDVDVPDTYTLEVLNTVNNCMTTASVVIDQNIEIPIADAGFAETLTCNLTEISLGGSSSSTGLEFIYEWYNDTNQLIGNDLNMDIDLPGNYTLIISNTENGCSAISNVVIDQDIETPVADAGQGGILSCDITSIYLDGNNSTGNNLTFQWFNESGSVINDQPQVQVSETGEYTLVVTNTVNGCSSSAVVEVVPDENLPTAIIGGGGTLTCSVTDVMLDGSASGSISGLMSLEWFDPNNLSLGNNPNINVAEPGVYTLVVTDDDNGCTISALVEVTQDIDPPIANAGENDTLSCSLTELTVIGSGSNANILTYEWLDDSNTSISNTQDVLISSPGVYTLVVTNMENGCTGEDEVEIVPDVNLPVAVAGPGGTLTCIVDALILNASASSQGNNFSYEWQAPGGNTISTELLVEVDQPGTYTIVVTNNYNGCSTQDVVDVLQDIALPVSDIIGIGPLEINCDVSSVILDGSNSMPFGELDFQWSTVDGNIMTDLDIPQVEINQAGTYVLTVTNLLNGCTDTETFEITDNLAPPSAVINPPPLLTCIAPEAQLNAINTSGNGTFVYQWTSNPTGGIVSGETTLNPMISQSGAYTLTILNIENGCESTFYVIVEEDIELPFAVANVDDELDCITEEVILTGFGSSTGPTISYVWSGPGIISGNTTLLPVANLPGTYIINVFNSQNGCLNSDEVIVNENTNVPSGIDVLITPPPCVGDPGSVEVVEVFGGEGPYLYSIDGGNSFYGISFFGGLNPGTYSITIQDAIGCLYEDEFYIAEAQPIYVTTEVDLEIELGDTVQLEAFVNIPLSQIDTIIWSPGEFLSCTNCLNPYAFPSSWTDFTITVVNINGCVAMDQIQLRVKKDRGIYIPNAFSPHNNDGINDVFMIFSDGKTVKNINTFQVFDRWGELVYENYNFMPDDPAYSWNGWLKEEPLNPAVFAYWAEIEFIDGVVILYKGDVTLLR